MGFLNHQQYGYSPLTWGPILQVGLGCLKILVNFWVLHLGPSPSGPRAVHGAHTEDLFEGVISDVLMFSVDFSCMKNREKTGRTSLNGGSSEMKDAKNHAEMLIASLPFFCGM